MPRPYGRSFVFNDVGAWHAKPVLPELDPRHFFTAPYGRGSAAGRLALVRKFNVRRNVETPNRRFGGGNWVRSVTLLRLAAPRRALRRLAEICAALAIGGPLISG